MDWFAWRKSQQICNSKSALPYIHIYSVIQNDISVAAGTIKIVPAVAAGTIRIVPAATDMSRNVGDIVRRQAIIWTIVGLLLTGPFGTNVSEIWIKKNALFRSHNVR